MGTTTMGIAAPVVALVGVIRTLLLVLGHCIVLYCRRTLMKYVDLIAPR